MSYSRLAYMAVGIETVENTAVIPSIFVPLMSEDIVTEYGHQPVMPVAANRAINLRNVRSAIPAPTGTVTIQAEPATIGHFLRGVYGAVTSGRFIPVTSSVGSFSVGETITGGTSGATATVVAWSSEGDYVLSGAQSGTFADGETITGGTSGATATLTETDNAVYGHQFVAPQNTLPTYTLEIGYQNEVRRYTGVRFNGITVNQVENIITLQVTITARAEFKHARITAVTTAAAGSRTITVDQTTGLVAGDTIRLYRPGVGYLAFLSAGVTSHTLGAVVNQTSFTITDLETSTAVGDLIVIGARTPTYTQDEEFVWIGGSQAYVADNITASLTGSVDSIEDFEISLINEIESRHAADGINVINRFPDSNFLKGLTGGGRLVRTYTDQTYLARLRSNTDTAIRIRHTGNQISTTGLEYMLEWRTPNVQLDPFEGNIGEDDLIGQEMEFQMYSSPADGFFHKALLVNTTSSY